MGLLDVPFEWYKLPDGVPLLGFEPKTYKKTVNMKEMFDEIIANPKLNKFEIVDKYKTKILDHAIDDFYQEILDDRPDDTYIFVVKINYEMMTSSIGNWIIWMSGQWMKCKDEYLLKMCREMSDDARRRMEETIYYSLEPRENSQR